MGVAIKLNLANVEGRSGNVEPGKWRADVADIEQGESKKGNDMLTWTWEVKEGPSEGETIKSYSILPEDMDEAFQLKEHLVGLGADPDADIDIKDSDRLIGKTAVIVVGSAKIKNEDTGEERTVARVNAILPIKKAGKTGPAAAAETASKTGKKAGKKGKASEEVAETEEELPF